MPAVITCPKCKTKFKLPDKLIGKAIKCSSCGTAFKTKAPPSTTGSRLRPILSLQPQSLPSWDWTDQFGASQMCLPVPHLSIGSPPTCWEIWPPNRGLPTPRLSRERPRRKERPADDLSEIFENPYLSPSAEREARENLQGDSNYQYRPLKLWAVLVSIGVAIHCLLTFGMTTVAYFLVPSEEAVEAAADEEIVAQALYFAAVLLGLVVSWFAVYIFTAVMVCIFMVQANKNVRALGASGLEISPGWSAGWWFIPIANLFKPVQSMSEIYRASIKPRGKAWKKISTPATVGVWWTFLAAGQHSGVMSKGSFDEEQLGQAGYTASGLEQQHLPADFRDHVDHDRIRNCKKAKRAGR